MNKRNFFFHKNSKEELSQKSLKTGVMKLAVLFLGMVSLSLVLAQVGLSAQMASQTREFGQKAKVKEELLKSRENLKNQIDQIEKLSNLEQKAKALGFTNLGANLFFVNRRDSLAKAH